MKNLPFSIRHSAFSVKRVGAPWGVSGAWTPPFRLPRILQAFARRQPGDLKLTPAVNHGTGGQVGLFGAANEIRVDGEWVQVTPKGEFPNVVGLQVVDDEALRLMTSEFKTIAAKMANRFRGVPFYVGHPDAEDPEDREIDPRYGKAKVARGLELEARNDGLWARMKPNAAGTEIIENGYFDFLSPYWGMMAIPGRPKAFRPAVLWSVGFTNNPQIPGLPVGKNNKQKETTNMPQWLIDLLVAAKVLKPAANEATEDEVKGAVKGLLELPAKLKTAEGDLATAVNEKKGVETQLGEANKTAAANEEKFKGERKLRIDLYLTGAVNTNKIKEADRPEWAGKFANDFDGTVKAIEVLKPALNADSKAKKLGHRRGEIDVPDNRVAAINTAASKFAKENGLDPAKDRVLIFSSLRSQQPKLFEEAEEAA